MDAWGLRRGRDLVAESKRLRAAGADVFAAADSFAAAFDPDPRLRPGCADPRRHRFLAALLDTPDYRGLHAAARLDDTAAGIAAAHLAEQFAALAREEAAAGAALRAVGRAVAEAGKEVAELHDAAGAFGLGPGANDPQVVAALFRRVRADPALRRISEPAGRFRRIAERQALCREHHGVEPVGKGPVIVCLDESGSMAGEKIHTAKALALALAWVARQQRRSCALVAYSGDSGERLLPLPPGRWDEGRLADGLSAFLGRGSDIDVPVRELPRMSAALKALPGVTDVVFVTDARCRLPAAVRDAFLAWKRAARARLVTLVVGSDPGDLAAVSDEIHVALALALAPDADAVGRVLSL